MATSPYFQNPYDYSQSTTKFGGEGDVANKYITNEIQAANQFNQNLPSYIQNQYTPQAQGIQTQAKQSAAQLKESQNQRGMLNSGNTQLKQGQLNANTAGQLATAKSGIVQNAMAQSDQMMAQAAGDAGQNALGYNTYQANASGVNSQLNNFYQQLQNNAFGNIGKGVGTYAGSLNSSGNTGIGAQTNGWSNYSPQASSGGLLGVNTNFGYK